MPNREATVPERPVAWLAARGFGRLSEAWMYRQACGMPRLDLRVVAPGCDEPETFPSVGFTLVESPKGRNMFKDTYLRRAWARFNAIRNRRFGGFVGSPAEARAWDRLVREQRPRVALCQYGPHAVHLFPLLNSHGVPVVAHFHGFDLTSALRGLAYRSRLIQMIPRFAACVVVADYMRDWLVDHGCPSANVHKIPCGAPIEELPRAERVDRMPCRFLAVGRLTPKKRPDLTLRAFARCVEQHPESRLTVVGGGKLERDCRALTKELGLDGSVDWMGPQPQEVVKEQLSEACVFVQHSVTAESGDKEGWPVAIAEAAGSGLPVVSTRHASIPEQVEHGVTGLLCDELDWQAMGDHMAALAADPDRRVAMGRAAREKLSAFDSANQVAQLEELLLSFASQADTGR